MTDDQEQKSGSFVDRMKESPRTVSALIIILIVAAAIYAFSGNKTAQQAQTSETPEPTTSPVASEKPATNDKNAATTKTPTATPTTVTKEDLTKQSQALPQATKTNDAYVEVAQKGDGSTRIARRAATRWLSENEAGYTVTNEHRIYIEDYIRKHMEKGRTTVGETKTVSFTLISDAVKAAGQLNAKQLSNLTKYTSALK